MTPAWLLAAAALAVDSPKAPAAAAAAPAVVGVAPEPLEAQAFKPFGEVIEIPGGVPPTADLGVVRAWHGLARARVHEDLEFGMFTVRMRVHEVAELERHARTPTVLVGLTGDHLLVVAPSVVGARGPDAAKVRVFQVRSGQAVLLHKGTWHTWPFPKGEEGQFLFAYRSGTGKKDAKARPFRGREVVRF